MPNDRVSTAQLAGVPDLDRPGLPPLPAALAARLAECRSLPSLPAAAARLIAIARSSDPRLTDYARTIDQDPALALRLLAVANSPFYLRDGGAVSTSNEAVSRLGVDATMGVALSFGLPRSANHAGINHQYFCQRAIIAASAAQELAKYFCPNQARPLFTSALLQDIGILALEALDGTDYTTLLPQLHLHQDLCGIEHDRYGCDHALVGACLAISWGVPS
ncbi:MAG: HDOD domain-containing protein, partial [Halomonadaceae bacterium]|nr:HDOD domain-containing protein [Halomonadaceae bacterium]